MTAHALDVCLAGLALYLFVRLSCRRRAPLPPGPSGWPLIGNLLDIPKEALHKNIGAMTSQYGPIIYFNVLGTQLVFLNSFKATKDLLQKQSAITSNRPHLTVGGDLAGWSNVTGFLQYGDMLRRHRNLVSHHIGSKSSITTIYADEEAKAKQFISSVLKNPGDLIEHCRRAAASWIFGISHGHSIGDDANIFADTASRVVRNIPEAMSPGCWLVDLFPILQYLPEWFPGCGFRKDVKRCREMVNEAVEKPHKFVSDQLANSDVAPSLSSQALQEDLTREDEEILKWASFTMLLAGFDTTLSMLLGFFRAMAMYPEVLERAQAEIDAVVGNDRLPTMEDRDVLPYVNAICVEILRWNVFISMTAHASTQDIIYEGYLIPKGSWLLPNIWFILSDPDTYPDPERFNPERFLGERQQPDPREACFGWGRRRCLGAHLAESMIFICVATALATLDVSTYVEDGVGYMPKYEFEESVLRRVMPFKCKITPRSEKVEDLLQA